MKAKVWIGEVDPKSQNSKANKQHRKMQTKATTTTKKKRNKNVGGKNVSKPPINA